MDNIIMGCKGEGEQLCCKGSHCCAAGEPMKRIGCVNPKDELFCIQCGLPCCEGGLIKPRLCVSSDGRCLCFRSAAAFPCTDDSAVPAMICAVFFVKCCPAPSGILQPPFPPKGGAPEVQSVER